MSLLTEIIFYMVAFIGLLLAGYLYANFMTKGLVWGVTKVKMFGRVRAWVLVKVHTISKPYYRVGKMQGNLMTYSPRNNKSPTGEKLVKTLTITHGTIENNMGVDYIEVDEMTNNILNKHDWKVVAGHDAELVNALMKRIAMLPKTLSQKEMLILVGLFIVALIAGYSAYKAGKAQEIAQMTFDLINATRTIPGNVGNIV